MKRHGKLENLDFIYISSFRSSKVSLLRWIEFKLYTMFTHLKSNIRRLRFAQNLFVHAQQLQNLRRLQFRLRLSFAIFISKCQGQTVTTTGFYLNQPYFLHDQLYIGCLRVRGKKRHFRVHTER